MPRKKETDPITRQKLLTMEDSLLKYAEDSAARMGISFSAYISILISGIRDEQLKITFR